MAVDVECCGPFDLALSLRAMQSFGRTAGELRAQQSQAADAATVALAGALAGETTLGQGVRIDGQPTLLEIRQVEAIPPVVRAEARPEPASPAALRAMVERLVNADLDLAPFYELAAGHPVLGPLARSFHGLKPFRPASLFEMLVTAIIEQQISLVAAYRIRERLVARFGAEVEGEPVFPAPETLAFAPLDDLAACGLSRRKAEYTVGVAGQIVDGGLDLDQLEKASSEEVKARIVAIRGFGAWSADYVLIRGLARPDAVPVDDLAVRTVVGRLLGDGSRPSPEETGALLAPLAPYRGLATFYLLVGSRLL
jgi:DNA-3-methyladenine glycosylase II